MCSWCRESIHGNSLECEAVILLELLLFILEAGGLDAQPVTGIGWNHMTVDAAQTHLKSTLLIVGSAVRISIEYMGPPTLMRVDQSLQSSNAGADLVAVKSGHDNISIECRLYMWARHDHDVHTYIHDRAAESGSTHQFWCMLTFMSSLFSSAGVHSVVWILASMPAMTRRAV